MATIHAAAAFAALSSASAGSLRASAPMNLTVVPPAQSGMLVDVGFLNPHAYNPNELFAQNWVFEGLVSYGPEGTLLPALATNWDITENGDGTSNVTFQLRQGVTFHDGQPWNAAACKLNFDNVFAPPLAATYHSWYDLPTKAIGWDAIDQFTFAVRLSGPYYPALTEMSFIRPLRFLSPAAFFTGPRENSCPIVRGNVSAAGSWVLCRGTKAPAGTGPWVFEAKVTNQRTITMSAMSVTPLNTGELVQQITFTANAAHWAGAPAVQRVVLPANLNSSAVRAGLEAGTIHIAYGAATLAPSDFVALRDGPATSSGALRALVSQPLQTRLMLLNTGAGRATASLAVRRAVNAALDRTALSDLLSNMELPATRVFSTDNAYSNVDVGTLPPTTAQPEQAASTLAGDGWLFASSSDEFRSKAGVQLAMDVLFVSTDASAEVLAPVIAAQLRSVGINATITGLPKMPYNDRGFAGSFDLMITETFGAPWDPESYAAAWRSRSFEYPAQLGLDGSGPTGVSKAALDADISAVFTMLDVTARASTWQRILTVANTEALFAPLTYMTTRAVMRSEVSGFTFGQQQFEMPLAGVALGGQGSGGSGGLSSGAIAGIAVGASVAGVLLVGGAVMLLRRK